MMKTTLFMSMVAAGLLAVSTTTFAQNLGTYAAAVGDAYASPIDRFTRSDLSYQRKVAGQRNTARSRFQGPAPAQDAE
jgi:hypothetical protein